MFQNDQYVFGIIHKNGTEKPALEPIGRGTIGEIALWLNILPGTATFLAPFGNESGYFVLPETEFKKLPQANRNEVSLCSQKFLNAQNEAGLKS
jgi:hypothetical protein